MLKQLLEHCEHLTLDNNGYTRVYNDSRNNNLIDKQTWVFCTKYAELLTKNNSALIFDFLKKYRNIDINNLTIGNIDFSINKYGDKGDLFYYHKGIPYVIHVKSCPESLYKPITHSLKSKNGTSFMGLASIIIRKDILPLKEQLAELWIRNKEDFIDFVINDIYNQNKIYISDLQFKNTVKNDK